MDSKKILLVEDDDHQRLLFREELEVDGYVVVEARGGKEALAKAKEESPDVVVLDIGLVGMDGLECLLKLHDLNPKLPIIIYTAYGSFKDNFLSWLADAYLIKSSDLTPLKESILELTSKEAA